MENYTKIILVGFVLTLFVLGCTFAYNGFKANENMLWAGLACMLFPGLFIIPFACGGIMWKQAGGNLAKEATGLLGIAEALLFLFGGAFIADMIVLIIWKLT